MRKQVNTLLIFIAILIVVMIIGLVVLGYNVLNKPEDINLFLHRIGIL